MKVCPYCHRELPDDSDFCIYCGKPLNKIQENKRNQTSYELQELKTKTTPNSFGKLGLMLFFIGLIIFDFILGTVFKTVGWNYKIPFYISAFIYSCSIVCGVMSLIIDYKDKKNGYQPNGSYGFSIVSIVLSLYMILLNLTQVILV